LTASQSVVRSVASPAVVASRARRASNVLKTLTAATLSTVAVDEVIAQVQGTPDDSLLRWTLSYFAVLSQSDSEAAMGMWVDPPHEKHFRHLSRGSSYKVTELVRETQSHVRVSVLGTNVGESTKEYNVLLAWTNTDLGPRVSDLTSIT
jgi:hypothetical protein